MLIKKKCHFNFVAYLQRHICSGFFLANSQLHYFARCFEPHLHVHQKAKLILSCSVIGYKMTYREKKISFIVIIPCTMFCAYAHTSSVWLTYGLMTQWYTSLSGSLHCLAGTSQLFFSAASLQLSSLTGQPSTTFTVDLVTSHELLPASNVCNIYQEYI